MCNALPAEAALNAITVKISKYSLPVGLSSALISLASNDQC